MLAKRDPSRASLRNIFQNRRKGSVGYAGRFPAEELDRLRLLRSCLTEE
jgi:hypothetical protein